MELNSEELKLKPCPFCGSEAELIGKQDRTDIFLRYFYWVICTSNRGEKCIKPTTGYCSEERAVNLWNQRSYECQS